MFTINLANQFKNKKILILEINSENQDILFLIKKKNKIINQENNMEINIINKQIHLISENHQTINEAEMIKEIKKWKENYDVILIDMEEKIENYFYILLEEINKIIFLTEANILQIKKSKKQLEEFIEIYKIEKEKINIVFHKINEETLSFNILKNILSEYNFLGKVNDIKNCNLLINHNMNQKFLNTKIKKQYQKIGSEILKNKNTKNYYLNKIENEI